MPPASVPDIPSDPFLLAAFWIGTAAFALVLLVTLLIAGLRASQRREQRRWEAFVAAWRPRLMDTIVAPDGAAGELPPLRGRDRQRFLRLWAYLQASVRGEAADRLNALAIRLRLDHTARRLLQRGSRAQRLLATLGAGYMRDRRALPPLRRLAAGRDGLLSVNAARAMVQIDADAAAVRLLPLILTRTDWDVARVATFLEGAAGAFGPLLTRSLPRLPMDQLPRALRLVGNFRVNLPPRIMRPLLEPRLPPPVLCEALALAETPELLDAVRACLSHPAGPVREQAVRQLGRLGDPSDIERLVPLLQDPHWPVRMAAARSLAGFAQVDAARLADLGRPGTVANDVIQQVLAERSAS